MNMVECGIFIRFHSMSRPLPVLCAKVKKHAAPRAVISFQVWEVPNQIHLDSFKYISIHINYIFV